MGKVGFRLRECGTQPPKELVERLQKYSTCNLADGCCNAYVMDRGIKPVGQPRKIAGPVLTVEIQPGDNLMLHKAMELARPGDILVVRMKGTADFSACGGLMMRRMKGLGIQGVVVDGCVRDLDEIQNVEFAVYARGLVPAGGTKHGPGQINFPVACGGIAVLPGYLLVADENGVVCFPPEDAEEIIQGAEKKLKKEKKALEEIAAGHLIKKDIDEILREQKILPN